MKKIAVDEKKAPPAGNLADLMAFALAYDAYAEIWASQNKDPEGPIASRGVTLAKKAVPMLVAGLDEIISSILERPDAGMLQVPLHRAQRGGPAVIIIRNHADFYKSFLTWLKLHSVVLQDTFTGRATKAIRQLAIAVQEDAPAARLNAVASVTPASNQTLIRHWVRDAAEEMGVPVSPVETLLIDVQQAQEIGRELKQVDAEIASTSPNTPKAADLQDKRTRVVESLEKVVDGSSDPSAVMAVAATAHATQNYATETGKKLGHTPDQEGAMMGRGKVLIAAGAGSGKTRVLASKVAYHINELGVDPSAIMATTFTNKASAELISRVGKYGGVIEGPALDNFGTTHAVAGKILDVRAPSFKKKEYIKKTEMWRHTTLIRLAVEQVKMPNIGGRPEVPPPPQSLFEDLLRPAPVQSLPPTPPPVAPTAPSPAVGYAQALKDTIAYFENAARTWSNPGARGWAAKSLPFLQDMSRKDPRQLSEKQKEYLNSLMGKVKAPYKPVNYRVAQEDDPSESDAPKPARKHQPMDDYVSFQRPLGKWFNLGRDLTRKVGKQDVAIPLGEFKNAISILKGKGLSPSEAWAGQGPYPPESDQAAVYGAYEFLKSPLGEKDFAGVGDMDDLLIDAVRALIGSPTARRQIQSQIKVLLVDEAQDLNRVQHLLFGLIAGQLDPQTLKPWADGHMTADTFALIGDDKQCVSINAMIDLADGGSRRAGDLQAGTDVKSYRNGTITNQRLLHAVLSDWDWGYRITTESGFSTTMTPNHRLWATEPQTAEGQVAVYLMYRPDMGFRVGITNKGKVGADDDFLNSYGSRCFLEKAERLWILEVCQNRDEALLKEIQYSLRYGIPTSVFNGEHRDLNTDRIEALFKEFGNNGLRLLEERHLSIHFPHWMAQSFTKHGRERHIITLLAHSGINSQVSMEWSGGKFDGALSGVRGLKEAPDNRRRLRRWFANYRDALAFAEDVSSKTGAPISHKLSTPEGTLREITASGLHVGMSVPVREGLGIILDPITKIEKVKDQFIDLDVDDASNFFADGILTHNSIYEFRGADPEEFIEKSDTVETGKQKGAFSTKLLDTNFRSGQAIVDAANNLIAHNQRQVPMVCKANVDRNGMGSIVRRAAEDTEEAAVSVAEDIEDIKEKALDGTLGYKDFGIAVRSNAEAYAYGVEMLKRGIPFKANAQFFNDPSTKALIGWLTLAEKGLDGPPDIMEKAVRDAAYVPLARLGKKFFEALDAKASGSWARWLVDGGWRQIYGYGSWAEKAEHFVRNIIYVTSLTGSPSNLLGNILDLRGIDGKSMREAMFQAVTEDDEMMSELSATAEGGIVTQDMIAEQAMAPIQPLVSLVQGKDDLGGAMNYVRKLQQVNSKKASKDTAAEIDRDAVTISTMHGWKGLEVKNMYVPMVGGKFPRTGPTGKTPEGPDLWSERRLAYVAITRAEQRCVLLDIPHPKLVDENGVPVRSQFLNEICVPTEGIPAGQSATNKEAAEKWTDKAILRLQWQEPKGA